MMDRKKDKIINHVQVAKLLGVTYPTLQKWIDTKRIDIPYIELAGKRRFWQSEVEEWMEKQKVTKNKPK